MTSEQIYIIGGGLIGIIGWFLNQYHTTFKETRQDVKTLLTKGAARDENIKDIQADIHILSTKTDQHDRRLQKVQSEVDFIKTKI